jgi:hypothetical protein
MSDEKDIILYQRAAVATIPDALNLRAIATDLLNSGLYPQIKGPTQAIAIIAAGQELGLGPTASLQYISIVNGKMCAEAKVWLALFHKSGGKTKVLKRDKEACRIEFSKPGREIYVHEYTHLMAQTEGLIGKGGAWAKMEETMLQWRCVSGGVRVYDPGVVMGIALTKEEAEDYPAGLPEAEGEVIEAKKIEPPEKAKKSPGRPRKAEPAPEAEKEPEKPATATPAPAAATPAAQPGRPQRLAAPPPTHEDPPEARYDEEGHSNEDKILEDAGFEPLPPPRPKETKKGGGFADEIGADSAESQTEEDVMAAALNEALEKQGVDVKSFKEWLLGHQPKMSRIKGGPLGRKFLVKWKNGAIRFHGGDPEDHKYLLIGIESAVSMFRYHTRPDPEPDKE